MIYVEISIQDKQGNGSECRDLIRNHAVADTSIFEDIRSKDRCDWSDCETVRREEREHKKDKNEFMRRVFKQRIVIVAKSSKRELTNSTDQKTKDKVFLSCEFSIERDTQRRNEEQENIRTHD